MRSTIPGYQCFALGIIAAVRPFGQGGEEACSDVVPGSCYSRAFELECRCKRKAPSPWNATAMIQWGNARRRLAFPPTPGTPRTKRSSPRVFKSSALASRHFPPRWFQRDEIIRVEEGGGHGRRLPKRNYPGPGHS